MGCGGEWRAARQFFFFQLNKMLQKRDVEQVLKWKGYLFFLQSGLKKLPTQKVTVFRGIPDIKIIQENYTTHSKVHWSSYSSTTTQETEARKFATNEGVVMRIEIINGKLIESYSAFKKEHEILLSPNMTLFVAHGVHEENGLKYVDLIQEAPGPTFVF